MKRTDVARRIGGTEETLRLWVNAARETGTMPAAPQAASAAEESDPPAPAVPQRAPVDPGQGLGAHEQAGILEIKKRHPSMGPAQIRAQLKRFKGWRISVRAIARVLKQHGYELVHTGGRPKDEVVYANRILELSMLRFAYTRRRSRASRRRIGTRSGRS
jgi:transposase